jgi:hypothetical protein
MPTNSDVLCAECGRFMVVTGVGVTVEELTDTQDAYKLWKADLFQCPDCGRETIAHFARGPYAEHYQSDYAVTRDRAGHIYPGRCRSLSESTS